MVFCGYVKSEQNPTGIFEYSDLTQNEIEMMGGYQQLNQFHKMQQVSNTQKGIQSPEFEFDQNDKEKIMKELMKNPPIHKTINEILSTFSID